MKYLFIFFCLTIFNHLYAQIFSFSEPVDVSKDLQHKIIGKFDNHLLVYSQQRSKNVIHTFSNDSLKWVKTTELDFLKNNINPLMIVNKKNNWLLLTYFIEKGKTIVEGYEFDENCNLSTQKTIAIFDNRYNLLPEQLQVSDNKQNLLIYQIKSENEIEIINCNLNNLDKIYQKTFYWKSINLYEELCGLKIDNQSNSYFIFEQNKQKRKLAKHRLVLYQIDSLASEKAIVLAIPNTSLQQLKLCVDEKNKQLLAAGFIANDVGTNAFFYARFVPNNSPFYNIVNMDETFIRSFTGLEKKKVKRVYNLVVKELIPRQDGGLIMISEEIAIKNYEMILNGTPATANTQVLSSQADYFYGNLLVNAFYPTGDIHWKQIFYKNQDSENDKGRYSSFFMLKTPASIRFLCNSEIALNPPIYEFQINALGEPKKQLLTNDFERDCQIEFTEGLQTTSNEGFSFFIRANKLRLVRILYP